MFAETDAQERTLDAIQDALGDLKRMGAELGAEVERQAPKIDGLAGHADKARDDILHVNRAAAKGFGVKPVKGAGRLGGEAGRGQVGGLHPPHPTPANDPHPTLRPAGVVVGRRGRCPGGGQGRHQGGGGGDQASAGAVR